MPGKLSTFSNSRLSSASQRRGDDNNADDNNYNDSDSNSAVSPSVKGSQNLLMLRTS